MSYSEGGPSNGQISYRYRAESTAIPIYRYRTLCGSVNHSEIVKHFWPVDSNMILWAIYPPCKYKGVDSYKVWPYAGQKSQLDLPRLIIEYSWNFKFWHFTADLHRSPIDRQTLRIWTVYFLCLPYPHLSIQPCKYEGMDMHNLSTVLCQIWGQFRWNLVLYGSKCPILKGVHQTARSPNGL